MKPCLGLIKSIPPNKKTDQVQGSVLKISQVKGCVWKVCNALWTLSVVSWLSKKSLGTKIQKGKLEWTACDDNTVYYCFKIDASLLGVTLCLAHSVERKATLVQLRPPWHTDMVLGNRTPAIIQRVETAADSDALHYAPLNAIIPSVAYHQVYLFRFKTQTSPPSLFSIHNCFSDVKMLVAHQVSISLCLDTPLHLPGR